MAQFIEFMGETEIENLIATLEEKLQEGSHLFMDTCALPWLIDHFHEANNVKRLDFDFFKKANQFYTGIESLISKYGPNPDSETKLHFIKAIAGEVKKGAGGSCAEVKNSLASYRNLTDNAKKTLDEDAEETMQDFHEHAERLYNFAKKEGKNASLSNLEVGLADHFFDIKPHFKKVREASEQDICLIASSFAKAIETEDDVYIVTEDDAIELATELFYNIIFCKQTGLSNKMMDRISPMKVHVLRTNGDSRYHVKFNYFTVKPGRHYGFREALALHFQLGSVQGSKAIQKALKDIPEKTKNTIYSLERFIPVKETEPEPCAEEAPEMSLVDETPSVEVIPEPEPIPALEVTYADDTPSHQGESSLKDAYEIVHEYALRAFEVQGETPEKEKALSALEGLLEYSDSSMKSVIENEILSFRKKHLVCALGDVNANLESLNSKMQDIISKPNWYETEAFEDIDVIKNQLRDYADRKKELEEKLKNI